MPLMPSALATTYDDCKKVICASMDGREKKVQGRTFYNFSTYEGQKNAAQMISL